MRDLAELSRLEERAKRLQAAETEVLTLGVRTASTQGGGASHDQSLHHRTRSAGGEGGSSPTFPSVSLQPIDELGQSRQVYTARSINLDPSHPANQIVPTERQTNTSLSNPQYQAARADPFSDAASVQTNGDDGSFLSQSTNVIPIAYVPSPTSENGKPARPLRDPNIDLGMSRKSKGAPPSAFGLAKPPALPDNGSVTSTSRMSTMSGAPSFMSSNSFALDAPTIAKVNIASAQRANIVQFGSLANAQRQGGPPPSSFGQGYPPPANGNQRRPSATKLTTGKSPLSTLAVSTFPSPSTSVTSDPFHDINQAVSSPTTPAGRPHSRADTFGQPYSNSAGSPARSVGHESADGNESIYSLGRPARPQSTMSAQSNFSAVLQSATIVRVGQHQASSPPPLPSNAQEMVRSGSSNTLGYPNALGREGDRSSSFTNASASSLLKDYTFTQPSPLDSPVRPPAFPSSDSTSTTTSLAYLSSLPLPPPPTAAPPPPPPLGQANRETQYSLDSTFDFLPPGAAGRPESAWRAAGGFKAPTEAVRGEGQGLEPVEFVGDEQTR